LAPLLSLFTLDKIKTFNKELPLIQFFLLFLLTSSNQLYSDFYLQGGHTLPQYSIFLSYKVIVLIFDKTYLNFYKILFKGYKVIGGIKRYILVRKRVREVALCEIYQSLPYTQFC